MSIPVVVLGGGSLKGESEPKSFLPLKGRWLIEWTLEALSSTSGLGEILVLLPPAKKKLSGVRVEFSEADLLLKLKRGVEFFAGSEWLLLVSGDLPLLTPESLKDFIERCFYFPADGYFPVLSRQTVENKFPQTKRTYAKLKEGCLTSGNIVLLRPQVLADNWGLGEKILLARKKPVQLAQILGLNAVLKFIFRLLTVKEAEERLSRLTGYNLKAVFSPYAEIGLDVDKKEDLDLVKQFLREGK